ncbi:hypothetical protein D3C78_1308180 [compost metagenome]
MYAQHISDGIIQDHHLSDGAVSAQHIKEGAVQSEHLAITPVQCIVGQPAVQQFGMSPFLLPAHESTAELTIPFEQCFLSSHYVIVAMTNHASYYVTLKEQSRESAIVEITRLKNSPVNYGVVTWIAIGNL